MASSLISNYINNKKSLELLENIYDNKKYSFKDLILCKKKLFRISADRKDLRAPVIPTEIRGILTVNEVGQHIPFMLWDVSNTGLGLLVQTKIKIESLVVITVGNPYLLKLEGTVIWCDEENDGYRCGIKITHPDNKLQNLYDEFIKILEKNSTLGTQ